MVTRFCFWQIFLALAKCLSYSQQERLDIEEKYSNLQEEVAGKTKKLKKVWTMLMQAKSEVNVLVTVHFGDIEKSQN